MVEIVSLIKFKRGSLKVRTGCLRGDELTEEYSGASTTEWLGHLSGGSLRWSFVFCGTIRAMVSVKYVVSSKIIVYKSCL